MKRILLASITILNFINCFTQDFSGTVTDSESGLPLSGVKVKIIEDNKSATTNADGEFTVTALDTDPKTVSWELSSYMYEEQYGLSPAVDLEVGLRKKKQSAASLRWGDYQNDCSVDVPEDPDWSVRFEERHLKGDFAADPRYTRRDPSAVIKVDGKFYVWYSYSLTNGAGKSAPWDLNDIYYATSLDGDTWEEQGPAVVRGAAGSYDYRSVFTTEILAHEGMYYLVYQAAADIGGVYGKNTVGMAYASSPDGPWTKLSSPILRPTNTTSAYFDNVCVHDPCLVFYKDKFYLYYKGESNNSVGYCGRHIKWGVAIADDPLGPYVKSEYNPITTTGHEVIVWPYDNGIAILQHKDGPESKTIQYATDGINFEIMGEVEHVPEAAGIFRAANPEDTPHGGISWGLCHILRWDSGPLGWMYIKRFERKPLRYSNIGSLSINQDTIYLTNESVVRLYPVIAPQDCKYKNVIWSSGNSDVADVTQNGFVSGVNHGVTIVYATSTFSDNYVDSVTVIVYDDFDAIKITVEGEDYNRQGGTYIDRLGPDDEYFYKRNGAIQYVDSGDWAEYDINIEEKGAYQFTFDLACAYDDAEITYSVDGDAVSGDFVPSNGYGDFGFETMESLVAKEFAYLSEGTHTIKLMATSHGILSWNLDKFEVMRVADTVIRDTSSGTFLRNTFSENDNEIKLYPNPAQDYINIQGISNGTYIVKIIDLQGREYDRYIFEANGNNRLSITGLHKGIYMLNIVGNNMSQAIRFIKM